MAAQHFFVEGCYLGSRQIPDCRVVPGLDVRWHHSYALFCMRCGEIWGRFLHDKAPLTQPIVRPCLRHGDGRLAFTHHNLGDPHNFDPDWPDEAVAYEFKAWMALLDRGEDRSAVSL